jgi:hypothetical protein
VAAVDLEHSFLQLGSFVESAYADSHPRQPFKNRSPWLDPTIMARTVLVMALGRGAA